MLDPVMLAPMLLPDDLQLLRYDPDGGTFDARESGTFRKLLGAAMLFELLDSGAAVRVPGRMPRALRKFVEQGRTTGPMLIAAAASPPTRPELTPAWAALRAQRRPTKPELVLATIRQPFDPDARLIAAGLVEAPTGDHRRLTEQGRTFARSRRAELDAYVIDGVRPAGEFAPATLRLAALLSLAREGRRVVWPAADPGHRGVIEDRLVELRQSLERGPDARNWRSVDTAVRSAMSDSAGN